jgi:hypothetical protein
MVLFVVAFANTPGLRGPGDRKNARGRPQEEGQDEGPAEIVQPWRSQDAPPQPETGRTFRSAVAGESYRNGDGSSRQEILRRCRTGEEILLVPEPDNPHDSDAVKVQRHNGEQIGYLPRGHRLADEIAAGRVSAVLD